VVIGNAAWIQFVDGDAADAVQEKYATTRASVKIAARISIQGAVLWTRYLLM
jgi:hypothetical protein